MNVNSYNAIGSVISEVPQDVIILTGVVNSTVIKSLEISNPSANVATVTIKRKTASAVEYLPIELELAPHTYLIMFDGCQVVIPSEHTLILNSDEETVSVVANVVEL